MLKRDVTMNEQNLSVEEVQQKIADYFEGVRANFSVHTFGCQFIVDIKYWDFKPKRQVRHDIEDMCERINITDLERNISQHCLFKTMQQLFNDNAVVYYQDGDNLHRSLLQEVIYSHAGNMDFGKNYD